MIGDETLQTALIAKFKLLAPFTSSFSPIPATEVREYDWQGKEFSYPNLRIDLEENMPYFDEQRQCTLQRIEFSVFIYSEQPSSKECSQLKTQVINNFGVGFTSQGVKFLEPRILDNIPAIREDSRTWRSQVRFGIKVFPG